MIPEEEAACLCVIAYIDLRFKAAMGNKPSYQYEVETEERTVFKSQQNEVYRIPALLYNPDQNVLMAFAEKRRTCDDTSSEALVMKTGEVIKDETTHGVSIKWSKQRTVEEAHLDGYRPMCPCPVYEKTSRTLFLFFICVEGTVSEQWQLRWGCNEARLCYVTTSDAGRSWSHVTNLTHSMAEIEDWATFAVGPGHGLQTERGRLIVPAYAYAFDSRSCCCCCSIRWRCSSTPYALSLYSDDKGHTWHFGKKLPVESLECEMAEISDETCNLIYCNARTKGGSRDEAVSDDNGDDFHKLTGPEKLLETGSGCEGSVVSFPAQSQAEDNDPRQSPNKWLLFVHPSSPTRRMDLGVYLNKFPGDPNAWSDPWVINHGPSGYSDLAYIGDGWFACLMECGKHRETEQIAFKVFSYSEVKKGIVV